MERTVKTWGEKWNIFKNDLCEVSFLKLHPWQRCSWHRHQTKYNLFFVISGELTIKLENDIATACKNEFFTTRPLEWHEFQTHDKATRIIEVMFVQYDAEDIERQVIGGPLEKED